MKTLTELQANAVKLNGLCEAANELVQNTGGSPSPSGNGLYALCEILVQKSDELACDLDRLQLAERATQKAQGQTPYLGAVTQ
jgi:hypothetical protein